MAQISARIGEIRRHIGLLTPPAATVTPTAAGRATSGSTSAGSFSSVLAGEVARTSPVPTAANTATVTGAARAYVPGTPVPTVPAPRTSPVTAAGGADSAAPPTAVAPSAAAAPRRDATAPTPSLTAGGAPAELARYRNGRIPAAALTPIGNGHQLWAPAAEAFRSMTAAAARDGVQIGINSSYRSFDDQVDVARRKGLYKNGGLAAVPGTSDHGWGRSVDLDLDAKAQTWMRAHGADHGFIEDTPREPWHWTYSPPT